MDSPYEDSPYPYNLLLLVGAMKSGTTTLWRYLCQHPQIVSNTRAKESQFFSSEERFERGPHRYLREYPGLGPTSWALDASTHYTKYPLYPNVPERISRLAIPVRLKFLYILRDPYERIESHIAHQVAQGRRQKMDDISPRSHVVRVSMYAMQLDRYYRALDRPDFTLIDFEELKSDPTTVCRKIEDSLGIPNIDYEPVEAANAKRSEAGIGAFRLSGEKKGRIRNALEGDASRLVKEYGFEPAARWMNQV